MNQPDEDKFICARCLTGAHDQCDDRGCMCPDATPCGNCGEGESAHDAHGCCPGNHAPLCPESGWDGTFPIPERLGR